MAKEKGWFGIDLDGCLAIYDGWRGPEHIGEPVPAMLAQVKDLVSKNERVKIFTARGGDPKQCELIQSWCVKHGLPALEVTNVKDMAMITLYDDRVIQVIANTGEPMVEKAGKGLAAAEELYFSLSGCNLTGPALLAAEKLREHLGIDVEFKFANIPEPKEESLIIPANAPLPPTRRIRR